MIFLCVSSIRKQYKLKETRVLFVFLNCSSIKIVIFQFSSLSESKNVFKTQHIVRIGINCQICMCFGESYKYIVQELTN